MNISRRAIIPIALALSVFASLAVAGEKSGFTQAAFQTAQKAGKPVLVEITASWCPTCKAQAPILNELRSQPKFKDLQTFSVDFDGQKDVVRSFKARMQSTLIVFKGAKEVGRSVGDTDKTSIEALLAKAL
jgi:thiol-disulfide isomerase/thioredoxin